MIRYLEQGEKKRCRSLWEEAFPEDRGPFLDYYMERKALENRILVLEEQGEILSMLHRNPYEIKAGNQDWTCDYLVGVATAKKARRRGYMRQLMEKALSDMEEEGMPFCFLMPADERLYTPFGFTYTYDQPRWALNDKGKLLLEAVRASEETDAKEVSVWMESWLSARYGVYTKRGSEYIKNLMAEVASENGYLESLFYREKMAGVRGIWGGERHEQRLLYADEEYLMEKEPPQKTIMARIVNLENFLKAIHLRSGQPEKHREIYLEIEDRGVRKNNKGFLWSLNTDTSYLLPGLCKKEPVPELCMEIEKLTGWLMGYSDFPETGFLDGQIRTLEQVFLDEIV